VLYSLFTSLGGLQTASISHHAPDDVDQQDEASLGLQAELMEIRATDRMAIMNTPLKELKLPNDVLIVAIHRGNELIIPSGTTEIQEDDRVIILSLLTEIPVLEKLLRNKKGFHLFGK